MRTLAVTWESAHHHGEAIQQDCCFRAMRHRPCGKMWPASTHQPVEHAGFDRFAATYLAPAGDRCRSLHATALASDTRPLCPAPSRRLCRVGSPWPPPLAPPTPQRIALPCSSASRLLWQSPTSHLRSSSDTAPRLPDADHCGNRPGPEMGSPGSRTRSVCTCQVL